MTQGRIYLVGAGPGSPDLITLRGLRALREATWIVADSLLPSDYHVQLGLRTGVRTTWLEHGETRDRYAEILEQMARAAEAGEVVVRLKNGDPFLFGRGCEETTFLTRRSISWEAIPGISVSTAGPTLGTLPLTSRDRGRSFAFVTARCSGGRLNSDFPRADTLIVFMGTSILGEIAEQLEADGWERSTPVAVLSRVSMCWENHCSGTLATIAELADRSGITSPAIVVVGEAAARPEELPPRPRILFAGEYPDDYRCLGDVVHWPALVTVPVAGASVGLSRHLGDLRSGRFGWIAFTDPASVSLFFRKVNDAGGDARWLGRTRVVAVGRHTRRRLIDHGLRADVTWSTDEVPAWESVLAGGGRRRVLVCRGEDDSAALEESILAAGGQAETAILFVRRPHPDLGRPLPAHDVILFTRPAELAAYVEAYGSVVRNAQAWCADDASASAWVGGQPNASPPLATAAVE
jgi:uroporphyrinogen III methyltransferase/synthase